jgi:pimeloyl-ACP methyl ester carboxylesterase
MPTVDLPDGRVNYRVAGPPDAVLPPVVFVHGILVNGELWTGVAAALATHGIRSYAPDLPLGAHPHPLRQDADITPRGVATLLTSFMDALGLTDVTLVGNDTGGALCQFLLDTDSSRVGRLVLTNCDAFDRFPPPPYGLLVKLARSPLRLWLMGQGIRLTPVRHSALGYGPLAAKPLDAALTRRWVTPLLTDAGVRRDTARFMRAMRPADLLDVSTRLHAFDRPVLLLWGAADRFFTLSFGHRLADAFPHARLVEIAGARTFIPLDEPDRLASEISAFLVTA